MTNETHQKKETTNPQKTNSALGSNQERKGKGGGGSHRTRKRSRTGTNTPTTATRHNNAPLNGTDTPHNSNVADNATQVRDLFQTFHISHFGPPYSPQTTTSKNAKEKLQQWFATFTHHEKVIPDMINTGSTAENATSGFTSLSPLFGVEGFYGKNLTQKEISDNTNELLHMWAPQEGSVATEIGKGTVIRHCETTSTLTVASFQGPRLAVIVFRAQN